MTIKVLVVLDGDFRFDVTGAPGQLDFTYSTLISALLGAGFDVTKANRSVDSSATPGFDSFQFNALPAGRSLLEFDAIWLIGWSGRNDVVTSTLTSQPGGLGAAQLNAIAAYMEAGGGVFAVGDHDSVGADMSGYLPRVRVMRTWYGLGDTASPFPQPLPTELQNFTKQDTGRADTIHKKTAADMPPSQYPPQADGVNNYVWFDNQSDRFSQTITPTPSGPAHPILRSDGRDITVFPDHMHEGNTLGELSAATYDYTTMMSPFGDTSKLEFRDVAGLRERPKVIATGQGFAQASRFAANPPALIAPVATPKTVNTLSTYDGRNVGVGRIVTGSTFHHYIDINLIGSTAIKNSVPAQNMVGTDAIQGHGYNDNAAVLDDIKSVYVNITNWIARPSPVLGLILERSTFSQDEVTANPRFDDAIFVTVDGLKPSQFPGGGITALGSPPGLAASAPTLAVPVGIPILVEVTKVDSDDPTLPDRLQRLTFTYRVRFTGDAFTFAGPVSTVSVSATLNSAAIAAPLTDAAWLELVKSANPFMLDLADGNPTVYLSSDIKVFHVLAGQTFHGVKLPDNATRTDALAFIHTLASNISSADFTGLPSTEEGSVLSTLPIALTFPPVLVYNFALARVRLSTAGADANTVRVFFRVFTTQTTAALTYQLDSSGFPVDGYRRTSGANPIALPGTQNGGSDWLSFPMFATNRFNPPEMQADPDNVQTVVAATGFRMYGALIDNNLQDPYLPPTPGSTASPVSLPTLMMGEHQCIVAQIEYSGAPVVDGSTPWTSDKLSQRNLAISVVANPGLDSSRTAMHTFEMETTPNSATAGQLPDELQLEWSANIPAGAVQRIFISTWKAQEVVDLANRIYPRHEIEVVDDHTIELPANGARYVPIPVSPGRQNGVISAELPLGVHKGQRFDLSVRQITSKSRRARMPPSKAQRISRAEADRLLAGLERAPAAGTKGAFTVGANKVLVTDLSIFDESGDHALLIEHPDPLAVAAVIQNSRQWRQTVGGFQLGVPVSTRDNMLVHHMQLLSVMRWRTAQLPRKSRWRNTMLHYVELLASKVQALGGNPWTVPATPDGVIPSGLGGSSDTEGELGNAIKVFLRFFRQPLGCGLLLIVFLLMLAIWFVLRH
jgi:hypothetical protein